MVRAVRAARTVAYLRGLLAPVERENSWALAESAGEASPDGMQRLLATADWDKDQVGDDLRGYVVEHLGDAAGVLVGDETGLMKKGANRPGVARQYSGNVGRTENSQIENSQIGVLADATATGPMLIEEHARRLLPMAPGGRNTSLKSHAFGGMQYCK